MKLVLVLSALVAVSAAYIVEQDQNTAFNYMERFGVPEAERIRKAEEEYFSSRITGGAPANLGQFPYQAGLISDIQGISGQGVCGGSLLSANRVITAAHCWFDGVNRAWRFTVVLGSVTLFAGGVRVQSTDVVMHSSWTPSLVRNDIAMIRLPVQLAFTNNIQPIALPTGSEVNEAFTGVTAVASGFGMLGNNININNNQFLSHVSLQVISNNVCWLSFPLIVQSSNICTSGAGGTSPCRGDSGGPLALTRSGRTILLGITSFGSPQGCESGNPAAFVRVTSYLDFIQANL
ncbi:collagenase-like [Leptidea sinapis]|uniref:collagenase-like n=1 Tax=Leptidea sinapis TaxID=189913 RepID=UPI0021383C52|nr:collagenase-like [Leptidea sinapis]